MAEVVLAGLLLVSLITNTYTSLLPKPFKRVRLNGLPLKINFRHPPLQLHARNQVYTFYENRSLRKDLKTDDSSYFPPNNERQKNSFENLFNKNGMIFLTIPRNEEDRFFKKFMNEVIKYKAEKNFTGLNDQRHKFYKEQKLKNKKSYIALQQIAITPKAMFNFDDLVG